MHLAARSKVTVAFRREPALPRPHPHRSMQMRTVCIVPAPGMPRRQNRTREPALCIAAAVMSALIDDANLAWWYAL
jgi:hypothetical protein